MPIDNKFIRKYQPPKMVVPRLNARKVQYRRPYMPIPRDKLENMIGKPIHLAWSKDEYHGCVWILVSIKGDTINLRTPRTGKKLTAKASDAMYVRDLEPQ